VSLISSELKIRFIKRLDSLIGKPIIQFLSAPLFNPVNQVRSILIIRPGGIGDALLLAPAINLLKSTYSDASITILAERRNCGAFSLIPAINKVLRYDSYTDFIHLLGSKYDLIIDAEQWHRMSAVIARLVSSSMKIGFDTNERRRLFTHPVPYFQDDYEAQSFINLLKPLKISGLFDDSCPFLSIPDSAVDEIGSLLGSVTSPYITIFPGASIKERQWGVDKFRLLVQFIADSGFYPVIIGGKEDEISGEAIVSGAHGLNLAGRTSLAGTAAVIAGSRLLVSGDSGVLHIAVGLGIPTVSLFGAGIARKWAPQGDNHQVLSRNLSCSPCTLFGTTPVCDSGVRCLNEIQSEEVYEAVSALLIKKR
jgi:ADP-heptose:LPS heptosyltransferase